MKTCIILTITLLLATVVWAETAPDHHMPTDLPEPVAIDYDAIKVKYAGKSHPEHLNAQAELNAMTKKRKNISIGIHEYKYVDVNGDIQVDEYYHEIEDEGDVLGDEDEYDVEFRHYPSDYHRHRY